MRFQQLNKEPNSVLRKKLYKSGKNWVVMSVLSFAGGLIFVGGPSITNAQASVTDTDVTTQNTNTNTTDNSAQTDSPTTSNNTETDENTDNLGTIEKTDNSANTSGNENEEPTKETPTPVSAPAAPVSNSDSNDSITEQPSSTEPTDSDNIVDQGTFSGDNGSQWTLDNNGKLTIGAGNVGYYNNDTDGWSSYSNANKIKSVVFENGAVAGTSLSKYFYNLPSLTNVNVSNLDVSKTANFNYMFAMNDLQHIGNLNEVDLTNWKIADGATMKHMFEISAIKKVTMPHSDLNNVDMESMFQNAKKLTNIDFSGVLSSSIINAYYMFENDESLTNVDISKLYFINIYPNSPYFFPTRSMFSGMTNLESITINKDMNLSNSDSDDGAGLSDYDTATYAKGWTNGGKIISAKELMKIYTDGSSSDPSSKLDTTWTAVHEDLRNYTIEYLDEQNNLIGKIEGSGYGRQVIQLQPSYPGYADNTSELDYEMTLLDEPDHVYTYHLANYFPIFLTITQSDKGASIPSGTPIELLFKDKNYIKQITDAIDSLDSDRTLDLDDTQIDLTYFTGLHLQGKLSDKVPEDWGLDSGTTIRDVLGMFLYSSNDSKIPDDVTAKDLVDKATITYYGKFVHFAKDKSYNMVFNFVYKPKETTGGGSSSSSSSHHNSSEPDENTDTNTSTNSTTKKLQTIATTTKAVNVFDKDGNLVGNRALGINTGWFSDEIHTVNGTEYYRVSTDEFAKASDVYVYVEQNKGVVRVNADQLGYLVDYQGHKITNRALKPSTDWITDRYAIINGEKYCRVATNEFINASYISFV